MRCFVAVDLSDATRDAIAGVQTRLRGAAPNADVGWVNPAKLHLTLKFLGEVDEPTDALRTELAGVAREHGPFDLSVGGIGGFPTGSRPRVLWIGLRAGLREIGLLAADVERACQRVGFPLDARPFRGHVTIARVRSPRGLSRVVRGMEAERETELGTWRVREVVLYRSHLGGSAGSTYEPLDRIALTGATGSDTAR
jgi:2'-5' RNA ligase